MNRAGTRSRRPQGIWDGGALLPIIDTTGNGIPDQNKQTPAVPVAMLRGANFFDDALNDTNLVGGVPRPGQNGYSTQNQRYLHLWVQTDGGGNPATIMIHAYNYSVGRWGKYFINSGQGGGAGIDFAEVEVLVTQGGLGVTTAHHYIIPLYGIDRVAFDHSPAGADPGTVVRAAVSTF